MAHCGVRYLTLCACCAMLRALDRALGAVLCMTSVQVALNRLFELCGIVCPFALQHDFVQEFHAVEMVRLVEFIAGEQLTFRHVRQLALLQDTLRALGQPRLRRVVNAIGRVLSPPEL